MCAKSGILSVADDSKPCRSTESCESRVPLFHCCASESGVLKLGFVALRCCVIYSALNQQEIFRLG